MFYITVDYNIKNFYNVLGIDEDAGAQAIKKAYHKLALKWHPDKNPEQGATAKFNEIRNAYEVLINPVERASYDSSLKKIKNAYDVLSDQDKRAEYDKLLAKQSAPNPILKTYSPEPPRGVKYHTSRSKSEICVGISNSSTNISEFISNLDKHLFTEKPLKPIYDQMINEIELFKNKPSEMRLIRADEKNDTPEHIFVKAPLDTIAAMIRNVFSGKDLLHSVKFEDEEKGFPQQRSFGR